MRYLIAVLLLPSAALPGESAYSWRTRADDPDRVYLYRDDKQIGGWCYTARHYRPFDGTNWGPPADAAPVRPPEQRVFVIPRQNRLVLTQPNFAPLPLRGPLRVRLGTAMGQIFADVAMNMMTDVVPRALADAVARGQYQLDVRFSATRSPQQSEGRTAPPNSSQPTRSPER